MTRKKLMLLGGIRYLLPVIETAHRMGVYVITADYLPDNVAHKYSDEYVNVSIMDREAVLKVAREREIDGILSFAVDPGVVTAAYVAERMGLASPPLESVEILQNKDKFRDFLTRNGFNCPFHRSYSEKKLALAEAQLFPYPLIVKPTDSAGSKGCVRVDKPSDLSVAIDCAIEASHSGRFIIEQFLEQVGSSSDTDSFSIDGNLVFCSFNCQYFDKNSSNPYTPAAYGWPSDMPRTVQEELRGEIQRLIRLLNLGTSIYNIETRLCTDGKAYIMECSPRGGGNRLSEVLKMATGQDLIENTVRYALNMPLVRMEDPKYGGEWAEVIVHSNKSGRYQGIRIKDGFPGRLVEEDMWVNQGDVVAEFSGANRAIGTLVVRFKSACERTAVLADISTWLTIDVW